MISQDGTIIQYILVSHPPYDFTGSYHNIYIDNKSYYIDNSTLCGSPTLSLVWFQQTEVGD